jgi:hypothetical protein
MPQRIYTATLRLSFATKNENKKRLKRAAFAGSHVEQGDVECVVSIQEPLRSWLLDLRQSMAPPLCPLARDK